MLHFTNTVLTSDYGGLLCIEVKLNVKKWQRRRVMSLPTAVQWLHSSWQATLDEREQRRMWNDAPLPFKQLGQRGADSMSKHSGLDIGQFNNAHRGSHCQLELHGGGGYTSGDTKWITWFTKERLFSFNCFSPRCRRDRVRAGACKETTLKQVTDTERRVRW